MLTTTLLTEYLVLTEHFIVYWYFLLNLSFSQLEGKPVLTTTLLGAEPGVTAAWNIDHKKVLPSVLHDTPSFLPS